MASDRSQDPLKDFATAVDQTLIRHRSIVDLLTKLSEAQARIGRAIAQSVTVCGCIGIEAGRQRIPADADVYSAHLYVQSHLVGNLCDRCRDTLTAEFGQALYYQAALARVLDVDLSDVLQQELDRLRTLGVFNLL
jgi:hypothetical protein